MAAKVLAEAGAEVAAARGRAAVGLRRRTGRCSRGTTTRPAAARATAAGPFGEFDGCIGGWDIEGEPYTVAPGSRFMWFRGAHARRPHEPLGPHLAALRAVGLQGPQPRRPRRRLADRLRGPEAVLRPARPAWSGSSARTRAWRTSRTASSCRRRSRAATSSLIQKACEGPRHPRDPVAALDPHAAARRPARLPLLRPVRPRLLDALELLDARPCCCRPRSPRAGSRIVHGRHGARGHDRRRGPRDRRRLRRHRHGRGPARARAGRRARGERLRVGAAPAQLALDAATRTASPTRAAAWAATSRTASARASRGFVPALAGLPPHNDDGVGGMHVYMPWWLDNRTLDFPRGYHVELGGGTAACPATASAAASSRCRAAATARQLKDDYRRYYGAVRRLRRPRRDDPEREELLRDRPRRGRPLGHPRAALPLEVVRPRAGAGPAHAADLRVDHRGDGRQGDRCGTGPRARTLRRPRTASRSGARSSTRRGRRAWGRARARRCSTSGARRTTRRTCSWPTRGRS